LVPNFSLFYYYYSNRVCYLCGIDRTFWKGMLP
jgi:hypothetical protein